MQENEYHPLLETFRLYAGWLLACMAVIYAVGSYQQARVLPFHSDLLQEWLESALILHVTFTAFIFLLLGSVHRGIGGGAWKGILLAIAGFLLIAFFRANTM